MGLLGFTFHETMSGTFHRLDAPFEDRAIEFTIDAKVDGLRRFVRDKTARIEGEVTVEGLADHAPLRGTLGLMVLDERRLPYDFTFDAADGRTYRLHGQKDVAWYALTDTMTTLPASLYDDAGKEIGRAVLRFDLRGDLVKFLRSWKLRVPVLQG
jgi:hypothetical protein